MWWMRHGLKARWGMANRYYAIVSKETGHPLTDGGQFLIFSSKVVCVTHWNAVHPDTRKGAKIHPIKIDAVLGLVNFGKFGGSH